MISNSKLKPSRQKNEYLFRYINKELGWEKVSIVRMRFFEKVSHFNMISRLPFFWLKWFRFGSVQVLCWIRLPNLFARLVFEFPTYLFSPIMSQFCNESFSFFLLCRFEKRELWAEYFPIFFHSSFVGLHELNVKEGIKEFWNTGEMTEKKSGWQSSMQSKTRKKNQNVREGEMEKERTK